MSSDNKLSPAKMKADYQEIEMDSSRFNSQISVLENSPSVLVKITFDGQESQVIEFPLASSADLEKTVKDLKQE